MKVAILCLLLFLTGGSYANDRNSFVGPEYEPPMSAIEISKVFYQNSSTIEFINTFLVRDAKIDSCVQTYVEQQAKSYARVVKENLYDLIHNFDKVVSRIQGKKPNQDTTTFDEKISALARVQCEAYYTLGVLK
jgi:hypothetical protein